MVEVRQVSKSYPRYRKPFDRVVEMLPFVEPAQHQEFWALRDVSLRVERGEAVALVGANGSGKSTLLQIVAGILSPTRGQVIVSGRVAALLELGAGFNPEFTGRENVCINAELLGLDRRQIADRFPSIAEFAGIGDFIDRPVKEYSTGMYVRLAFATAIHVDPEILIVDEALAVGDAAYSQKCIRRLEQMRASGVTLLFVSHDLALVKKLADRALLLVKGTVTAEGKPSDVVNRYMAHVLSLDPAAAPSEPAPTGAGNRHGDGTTRIDRVQLEDSQRNPLSELHSGTPCQVRVSLQATRDVEQFVVGILIRDRIGMDVFGTNTLAEGQILGPLRRGERCDVDFRFRCDLGRGEYTLTAATQYPDGASQDWQDDTLTFRVADPTGVAGVVRLQTEVDWRRIG